jgi:AcrR family transcriptional regulator
MSKVSIQSQSRAISPLEEHAATATSFRGRGAGEPVLATATALSARFGENGVSTREQASAAAVNEAAVYRHRPRKRDLYWAELESELQQLGFRGDLLTTIADAPDGGAARARAFDLLTEALMPRSEDLFGFFKTRLWS